MGDFGLAAVETNMQNNVHYGKGDPDKNSTPIQQDIYSLGLLFIELFCGELKENATQLKRTSKYLELAIRCISKREVRPSLSAILSELQNLNYKDEGKNYRRMSKKLKEQPKRLQHEYTDE